MGPRRQIGMRPFTAVALLLVAVLSACGTEGGPTPAGPAPADLSGTYVVTSVTDGGADRPAVEGSEIRLSFKAGTLGIHAGCNHLSGSYSVTGDRLEVGAMGGTEMGCPQPLMDQDAWLAGLFAAPVTVGEDPLTLTSGDVVLTLKPREEVSPDRPLLGTRWVLDGVIDGQSVGSIPAGPEVVLALEEGKPASVTGLCNGFGAEVSVSEADRTIAWEPGMRTLMACADPARQKLDEQVSSLLTGDTAYVIEERQLTIRRDAIGLTFRAE